MCVDCKDPELGILNSSHLEIVMNMVPEQKKFAQDLFEVMSSKLNSKISFFIALVVMKDFLSKNYYGVLSEYKIVRLPLSIIGEDQNRYRTPVVDNLHESILSGSMSDLMMNEIRLFLQKNGLSFLSLCCCGICLGTNADINKYYGSEDHLRMEKLRSAIDGVGNPIASIDRFDDIKVRTMDLANNNCEEKIFLRIEDILSECSKVSIFEADIDSSLKYFIKQALVDSVTKKAA